MAHVFVCNIVLAVLTSAPALAAGSVTLAWDANTNAAALGYKLYLGVASQTYTNALDAGSATTASVSNLTAGVTYYFAATAYDTNGLESAYSSEVSYTAPGTASNTAPTLNALADVAINENAGTQTVNLAGITSGATNEVQTLTVTATSSNPSLIPNPTVAYTSPNTTGTLTFTPVASQFGSATITVTVNDGQTQNNTVTRTFTVTVNAVNQVPTLNALANVTINENAGNQTVNLAGITSGATNEVQTLTVTATSSNPSLIPNPTVAYTSPNTTGTLTFTPVASQFGSATITVTVNDGQTQNNTVTRTFTVTVNAVNQVPTLNALANVTINENAGNQTVNLAGITSGATTEVQTLTVTATSSNPSLIPNPTVAYTSPNTTGTLTFTPVASQFGSATITVTVNDGQTQNNTVTRTFTVTVNAVNQAPTLNALANVAVNENAGIQTVNLAGITSGATNEVQTLTVTATSSNPSLIPNPTVAYTSPNTTGTLTFTPVASQFGSATITVTVNDGQTQNNTVTRTFTVTVNAVNQAPTLNALANVAVNENDGAQTVNLAGITSGATNEVQTLTVTATSSNPSLIPNPTVAYTSPNTTGTLTFTPVASQFGSATITVTVNDGQTQNNTISRAFTVTVNAVNQAPTLNALANVAVNENDGAQTVNLAGITSGATNEAQTLAVTATSSNPSLIPNPTVAYTSPNTTGTLTFTPVASQFGSATITVTVNDGQTQNNTISRAFTVTVNPVNQAPTLNALANVTINESDGTQTVNLAGITSGATNEVQTLTVTATSSNPSLIPNPTVAYTSPNTTGTLTFTPVASQFGSATITVTVNDGQTQNNTVTRTFTVTVNAVNQAPTLNALANVIINENDGTQTVNLAGITSGATNEVQTLTVTATSSNPSLIPNPTVAYTSPNTTGTLTFAPVASQFGSATITVTVNDGQTQNNTVTRTFTVTVNAVNQAPTLNALANVIINENDGTQTVNLAGITSGATNEVQTLTVTATSSNPSLIPNPTVAYTSPNTTGTLTFAPVAYAFGSATITVTVNDGQTQNNTVTRSFTVTVNAVNQPPTLDPLASVNINENATAQTVNLTGITSGAANETQTLTVTATSSVPGLIPNPTVNYTSPNATGSLTFAPAANAFGSATITVTVNDGQAQNNTITRSFRLTVNSPPTISAITNQVVVENTSAGPLPFTIGDVETAASNLTLLATSSLPTLVPATNIVFSGTDSNRTVTVTPLAGQIGEADITIAVSDGSASTSNTFHLSVQVAVQRPPPNTAPTITAIADQTTAANTATPAIAFTIGDAETPAANLTLSAASSNPALLPVSNVVFGGSDSNRTVTLTPVTGQSGSASVTITVSDGTDTTSVTFQLTVTSAPIFVKKQGKGQVSPALVTTQPLTIGQTYTITAIPDPGQVFGGWVGSVTSASPKLTFTVTPNFVLEADFYALTIITNGLGTISPNLCAAQNLVAGQTYSVTAQPGSGQVFAGWTGTFTSATSRLTFVMGTNTVLQANFVANPFVTMQGTYNGLFYEDKVHQISSGSFGIAVTTRGSYSGWLQTGANRYGFSGQFDSQGRASARINRWGAASLSLQLQLGSGAQANQISGQVTDGTWTASLSGDRAVFDSQTSPAPWSGSYTFIIPGQLDDPTQPGGNSYGTVRVTAGGSVLLAGTLADGTKFSQSAAVAKDGSWPLYVPLYSGQGSMVSWLTFTNRPTDDVSGALNWFKPANARTRYYPAGFTYECLAVGSAYLAPACATNFILACTNATITFAGGNLEADFANLIGLGLSNRVTNLSPNALSLTFALSTGTFTGSVADPSTGQTLPFSGAVFQKLNAGYGLLVGTNQTSQVTLGQ